MIRTLSMTVRSDTNTPSRSLAAAAMLSASLFAAMAAGLSTAQGQDQTAGLTGANHTDDVVMARQLLMDGIDEAMMPIDIAPTNKDAKLDELKAHAFTINTLLSVFPHLFPPQTKPGKSADGTASVTTATEAIWQDFDKFYGLTQAAAATALELGQANNMDEFKERAIKLRTACDGCHAQYMHVEGPHP